MDAFTIRPATLADIADIQRVRHSVRENRLSDPSRVTDADVADYICRRGRGWVAMVGEVVVGFAVADLEDHNVWALFVHEDWERRGIGAALHREMMDWYFGQTAATIWLSTAPGTRAAAWYPRAGWRRVGMTAGGEVRFEMDEADWRGQGRA
jgi:GNAT superfamily N-acetyltransferase